MRELSTITPDVTALKALAHPLRLKMLGLLRLEGPQTATTLARRLELNTGATSYHLRQLETHGFIETDPERGNRRDRWWRARHDATRIETAQAEGAALEAGLAITQSVINHYFGALQRAHDAYPTLPPEWRAAQQMNDATMAMAPEAARALLEAMTALMWEAKAAAPAPGAPLPEEWRPFTVQVHGFPYTAPDRKDGAAG